MTDRRRYEIAGEEIPRMLAKKARREAEEQKSLWEQVEELRQRLKAEQEARAELEARLRKVEERGTQVGFQSWAHPPCESCEGKGRVWVAWMNQYSTWQRCPDCNGTGRA